MRATISVVLTLIIVGLSAMAFRTQHHRAVRPLAGPAVKVFVDGGHGSGVHIGNGLVLTASHVVRGETSIRLLTDRGTKAAATVLWSNDEYDVALLQSPTLRAKDVAINCQNPNVGDEIQLVGNPLSLEFVHVFGRVAAGVAERTPWRFAYLVDMTIANGMSGGPVLDQSGQLVGLLTGEAIHVLAPNAPFIVSIGYVVPASAVCTLLART